jgi:hypothetical protein
MPNEQVKSRLQALTKNQLLCLAEKFNVKLKSSEKKNKEKNSRRDSAESSSQ